MKLKKDVLQKIKSEILVSCQAYDENPHASVEAMVTMAIAGKMGGCVGFRANSPEYVKAIREAVGEEYVIIGIWKQHIPGNDVYITTNMEAVRELITAGSDIIALDCTERLNAFGYKGVELISQIQAEFPNVTTMADCSSIEEAKTAKEHGADIVACTMSGYTEYTKERFELGVDLDMITAMSELRDVHVLAEGRIWTREDCIAAFKAGAMTCVIGTAITSPWMITKRFVEAKNELFK